MTRNQLLRNIKRKLKENIETEIDRQGSEIENIQENSKMFEAIKMLNSQKLSNLIFHGKDGKPLLNTQDIYNEMKKHFEHYFYVKNYQTIETFEGENNLSTHQSVWKKSKLS